MQVRGNLPSIKLTIRELFTKFEVKHNDKEQLDLFNINF